VLISTPPCLIIFNSDNNFRFSAIVLDKYANKQQDNNNKEQQEEQESDSLYSKIFSARLRLRKELLSDSAETE